MKKVIGYIRCSTFEQKQSGLGLEAQREKIESYCSLYDLNLLQIIQDSCSGKNLNRAGLTTILKMLRSGEADGIVIAKLDRLTRSVKDMGTLLETYFAEKNSMHVVAEQIDTSSASGRMVLNILISVAQWERETIGERTKDALQAKRSRGEKTGGSVPYGYNSEGGMLVPNIQEQKVIRTIQNLRHNGFSYQKIANKLNQEGYLTKSGCEWKYKIVRKVYLREKRWQQKHMKELSYVS